MYSTIMTILVNSSFKDFFFESDIAVKGNILDLLH